MDRPSSQTFSSAAGLVGLLTGLLGGAAAVVMISWPEQVAKGPLSYPFTHDGFVVLQSIFAVHHLGLVMLLVALARSGAMGPGRLGQIGAWIAVAGMLMLDFNELNAIRFVDWDVEKANTGVLGMIYGISCNLIGLGMLIAGVMSVRARAWTGWRRWIAGVIGVATFVELTPGMFGGYVIARLAIGLWMLLFGALGWATYVEARGTPLPHTVPSSSP